ncbi:MAG: DNA polymerase III subunit delta [Oscillospiraceae bacterium]|nr:DNA polymerase III subunit delta [Oscillospiraceae bacterium]
MLYKNENSFSKAFMDTGAAGLYLLFGSESYLIDLWAKKIIRTVCKDESAFNFQKLDGRKLDPDMLYDATETLPFGALEKCVLLDDVDPKRFNAEDFLKLEEVFSDLNPACVLLVTGKPHLFDGANAKKLVKLAEKYGTAVELGARDAAGLVAFIKSAAKKNGCKIETAVCKYILQVCENDMHTLNTETAKICAYAGGGTVLKAHVDAVSIPKIEARVFDLSRNILSGNTKRAMDILSNLFYLRESPVAILAVLEMSFVDMYRARAAKNEGKTTEDMSRAFGYKSSYRVQNAFSSRLSSQQLRRALNTLYDCDLKMKSTGIDDKILLEKAVTELFLIVG